ncbi:chromate efflux transporter [Novilysobacter selenitireducens]|uniref:Chromate efflux transporter n=1 Tax=Novilysobacter selenitireducens TaxID=2872639 RepID=A0ABS7T248_9GAMM|nr:chromate efflux transporter [Lysobacter selenitireducens]MBZ4037944.1 chromate efflux transporter [Lysobacter selenitireducens]
MSTKDGRDTRARDIFGAFLRLGLTAFGGPIAHIGYLRHEFVTRRGWLDEVRFARLLALCQFLPGPASSQLGFAIGLHRAGLRGALAAFAGFTLPSALLMLAFAWLAPRLDGGPGSAAIHGLKLVAVAVVAHGVLGMARTLLPDARHALVAVLAAALVLVVASPWMQLGVVAIGAVLGWLMLRPSARPANAPDNSVAPGGARLAALAFAALLAVAFLVPVSGGPSLVAIGAAFVRAGALVFGGGHVVLPLLEASMVAPGWLDADTFLAGYGAAQAVPGPMFTLSAYLGAQVGGPVGALVALLGIFLPGFLLLWAVLPSWDRVAAMPRARRAVAGVNAAVVGLLAAALVDPLWMQGVGDWRDAVIAAVGFTILLAGRAPLWTVAWCVLASVGVGLAVA